MQSRRLLVLSGSLLAISFGSSGARALAVTPPFAITATNVTMPMTGNGSSQYTVTSIPLTGTLGITCQYTGPMTVAKIPICPMTPPVANQVTAGQTFTGSITFYPYGAPVPAGLHRMPHRSRYLSATGLSLAGAFMLGFGARRRRWRWLTLVFFAAGTLAGMMEIGACGGNSSNMTPGTYPYTISANWESSGPAILGSLATTTINVTVP